MYILKVHIYMKDNLQEATARLQVTTAHCTARTCTHCTVHKDTF